MKPVAAWWTKWPERLKYETQALDESGVTWVRDENAYRAGVLKLHLEVPHDGETLRLVVVYPDLFPYFRCELYAPALDLAHHQNPFEKNLCLIGRRSHFWDTGTTAAELIRERLPVVLRAGASVDKYEVAGLEQQHAEPMSDYYNYVAESIVIVQSDWRIPNDEAYGYLVIGTQTPKDRRVQACLRGAVLEVRDAENKSIIRADKAIRSAFSGRTVDGCWVRLAKPFREADQTRIMEHVVQVCPFAASADWNHIEHEGKPMWLQVWGIVFPEETAWREVGDGWLFTYRAEKKRPTARERNRNGQKKRRRTRK